MGFNVNNETKLVTVDHSHNNYSVTTTEGNPTTKIFNGLSVISILQRTKGKRSKDALGDNSPMLYAFKGIGDLSTTYSSIASLLPNCFEILDQVIDNSNVVWDCVIPMPSSHNIANILSKRVIRRSSASRLEYSALKKISASDAKLQIQSLSIKSKDKTRLNGYINRFAKKSSWGHDFQMKSIQIPKLRQHINPLTLDSFSNNTPPRNILLIDDMVTSGRTLACAELAIKARYPMTNISALTLLGSSQ